MTTDFAPDKLKYKDQFSMTVAIDTKLANIEVILVNQKVVKA